MSSPVQYRIDPARSARTKIDPTRNGVWVAVCANSRDELDDPGVKIAAVEYARVRFKTPGAIDQTQGPFEDHGTTTTRPVEPKGTANAGVVDENEYRRMVAASNLTKAATGGVGVPFVVFHRIAADVL